MRLLVDEDLPRSLAPALRHAGADAEDVRDVGLRGKPDSEIVTYATAQQRAVITGDVGIANLLTFPLGSHAGIVLARFPNELPTSALVIEIVRALTALRDDDVAGNVVVIEAGHIRIRRPTA